MNIGLVDIDGHNLLIAPEGIEIQGYLQERRHNRTLLIAPEGIEIFKAHRRLAEHPFLLIAPEGIEIANNAGVVSSFTPLNRTRRN